MKGVEKCVHNQQIIKMACDKYYPRHINEIPQKDDVLQRKIRRFIVHAVKYK